MPAPNIPPSSHPKNLLAPVLVTFLIVAIAGGIFLYSFGQFGQRARAKKLKNPVAATPAAIDAGMNVYLERCQNCHGVNGDGKGPKAAELSVAPADFRDARAMAAITDGELYWRITKGARPMPSFETLTEEERWQAVDYIRTFAGRSTPR
ncbi:MAG TPA: cytochrome c [Candidatus Acidoferrales bacterium]|jgi:mono/diheme cytochrome c family protein|nr:cytochrome c [Candidatus Acidoferrales bacterium]